MAGVSPGPELIGVPRRKILVVDDNRDGADMLALRLKLAGQDVLTAYDGRSAIALAKANRPDLVLLDIGLPEMDGYAVARELRAAEETRAAILVAVTGFGTDDDRARAAAAGFDHHVVKPIDTHQLKMILAAGAES
jgi:CheY-like chemotaxis protein